MQQNQSNNTGPIKMSKDADMHGSATHRTHTCPQANMGSKPCIAQDVPQQLSHWAA